MKKENEITWKDFMKESAAKGSINDLPEGYNPEEKGFVGFPFFISKKVTPVPQKVQAKPGVSKGSAGMKNK